MHILLNSILSTVLTTCDKHAEFSRNVVTERRREFRGGNAKFSCSPNATLTYRPPESPHPVVPDIPTPPDSHLEMFLLARSQLARRETGLVNSFELF